MRMQLVPVLVASLVTVVIAQSVHAEIVGLKRTDSIVDGGNLDTIFSNAITGNTITLHTGAGVVQDAPLATVSNSRYQNYGARTLADGSFNGAGTGLYKFDVLSVPGFIGGTINLAELRIQTNNGNSGTRDVAQVLTHDWIEGTGDGQYPGNIGGGVTSAHPMGNHTGANQTADGTSQTDAASWGPAADSFFSSADYGSVVGIKPQGGVGELYFVWDVTDFVQNWADGEDNLGFARIGDGNWNWRYSEFGEDAEPVLFIDFEPFVEPQVVPEPASIAIWSLFGLGLCGYGYRRWRRAG